MTVYLDFEKPVAALEARIAELQETADESAIDATSEIEKLRAKADKLLSLSLIHISEPTRPY